ncbi:MAG: transcriptional repressor [Armatimonadetes bacterium]|nr:transcriptional repressor [Armatimonadota bacterium]
MRKTRQYQAVLEALRSTRAHPSAEWIYDQVRGQVPGVSLATVYRILKTLEVEGVIASLEYAGRRTRFDGYPGPHNHIVCLRCGAIEDVEAAPDESTQKKIELSTGFRVSHYRFEWFGLCPRCATNSDPLRSKHSDSYYNSDKGAQHE